MVISRGSRRVLLGVCVTVMATTGLVVSGEAANCGDIAGPFFTRVPCACGDTVVTSTRLRSTDPVVTTPCTTTDQALIIGTDNIALDCAGLAIRGATVETGLTLQSALRGIFGQRNGVTVLRCSVEFFLDGIALLGNGNRILGNRTHQTFGGIVIEGNDNWVVGNLTETAREAGLIVLDGRRNTVWNNRATRCFDGLFFDGEDGRIIGNLLNENDRLGLGLAGSHNFLAGNAAHRNGDGEEGPQRGDGFVVEGTGNILTGNIANNNEAKGFCVVGGNFGVLNFAAGNGESPELDFDCQIAVSLRSRLE